MGIYRELLHEQRAIFAFWAYELSNKQPQEPLLYSQQTFSSRYRMEDPCLSSRKLPIFSSYRVKVFRD